MSNDVNLKELDILNVESIFGKENLQIPDYQRPYSWGKENVKQLIGDLVLFMKQNRQNYRLGNLIVHHNDSGRLDIVDGQQRLITLTILLYLLNKNYENKLFNSKIDNSISRSKISENKQAVKKILDRFDSKTKDKLKEFILINCEFVYIELKDLSEAFQLFDSQNARGKSLEAYDLLKAFHLREMKDEPEPEKLDCVKKWERYIDSNKMKSILGDNLYRIRKWLKGEDAYYFDKNSISEFKGINPEEIKFYPYLRGYLLNITLIENIEKDVFTRALDYKVDYPFQISQVIINGKYFFKYVFYYSELFDSLFNNKNHPFHEFYTQKTAYEGSRRQGDNYVKELYKAISLTYYDKFGETDFEKAWIELYKWAYSLRLTKNRVRYLSINKYVKDCRIFNDLHNSYRHLALFETPLEKPDKIVRDIKEIIEVFES